MSMGILVGGLLGAGVGSLATHELVTVACYLLGFLGGAIIGAFIGLRSQDS